MARQVRNRTSSSPCNSILCMLMCFVYRQCWTWRKRGYSLLSCVYSPFARRTRLTLVFRFFPFSSLSLSLYIFCWWEGLIFYRPRRHSAHYRIFFSSAMLMQSHIFQSFDGIEWRWTTCGALFSPPNGQKENRRSMSTRGTALTFVEH